MNATARAAAGLGFEVIELVINWGLGVDSTAYLVKMLEDPAAHGVDLARTLVMHQLTGDEWPATRAHADIGKSGYQNLRNARARAPPPAVRMCRRPANRATAQPRRHNQD